MDFSPTAEQATWRERVVAFARAELNQDLADRDRAETFDPTNWKKCAQLGILGWNVPEQYGGRGRDILTAVFLMEALGYGCRDNGLTLAVNAQVWTIQEPLLTFGSEAQKHRYLPRLCSGEILAADAVTEEGAGSDALGMATTARKTADGYVLDGRKTLIGMAPVADLALVFAKTDPAAGQWGVSAFLVEKGTPGFTATARLSKAGLRTFPMGGFEFSGCLVPETCRLGAEGVGLSMFNSTMEWERSFILASHVGAMARQLDDCVAHARTREQFGRSIGSFQSVSNRIADMKVRLETARLLLYKLAWMKAKSQPAALEAAIAKLYLSECFLDSSLDAVRTHGGVGYLSERGVDRDLRDALGGVIYAGTSDIQRNLIARLLGLQVS
ncbi:MAG: acyl-CoA dehydrogenase family protein [Acidobacteriota bacterium]